jgi:hypothetical protein
MGAHIRLGELLMRAGVLSAQQIETAREEQERWGGRLGRVLVERGYLSEPVLVRVLSKQLGIRPASLERAWVPPDIIQRLGQDFLRDHAVCPEGVDEGSRTLRLAMADPTDVAVIDDAQFRTGLRVVALIAGESEIEATLDRMLGWTAAPNSDFQDRLESAAEPSSSPANDPLAELSLTQAQQERALRVLVDLLIEGGVFTREQYLDLLSRQ